MSDEPKPADGGILGRARRLANQVGDYARSDEAREKLDGLKKKAVEVGGMAQDGTKRIVEGTKQAAAQARDKADEFSKSEKVQVIRAKAKGDWEEIRGGNFRGSRLSDSPIVVGLAIFFFFPLGLYFLWKHPVLGRSKKWWWVGGVWSLLILVAAINGDKEKKPATAVAGRALSTEETGTTSGETPTATQRPRQSTSSRAVEEAESGDETPARGKGPKPKKAKKGINLENYERITDGMAREDVEEMLGKGSELGSTGDEKAIFYEKRNIVTGSRRWVEVHYLGGRVTVKFKDGF